MAEYIPHPSYLHHGWVVGIDEQGTGEYVVVTSRDGSIDIEPGEWPALRALIDRMVDQLR